MQAASLRQMIAALAASSVSCGDSAVGFRVPELVSAIVLPFELLAALAVSQQSGALRGRAISGPSFAKT